MTRAAAPTLLNVLREFDDVLLAQVGGLHSVETSTIAGSLEKLVADGGPIEFVTRVDLVLCASKPLAIDVGLIERATNAEELLRYVVDQHYRPFQEQLAKGAHAASIQWQTAMSL